MHVVRRTADSSHTLQCKGSDRFSRALRAESRVRLAKDRLLYVLFLFVLLSLTSSTVAAQNRPRLRVLDAPASDGSISFIVVPPNGRTLRGKRVLLRLKRASRSDWEKKVTTARLRKGRRIQLTVSNLPAGIYIAQAKLKARGSKSAWSVRRMTPLVTDAPGHESGNPPEPPGGSAVTMPEIEFPLTACPEGTEDVLLDELNSIRESESLQPLTRDLLLDISARQHSLMMAETHNMTHDGWFDGIWATGYHGSSLGQNIAKYIQDPIVLMAAWMNSEGHRLNIVKEKYTEIGVSCVRASDGEYYWTNNFGTP